uniref:DRBM domain-containing protein n=1 Tax=Solanum lycopersicum TaxID=4081 RepID=A0A3Q7GJ67_SOLLC
MEFPKFTSSIPPAQVMYKNQLQEYTQKNVKQLPIYQTVNEGFPHAPKFRAKVLVNGSEYESKSTYPTKKEAEQAVAKIAYECIHSEMDARDISLIYKEPMLCKSILYEFAVKRNLDRPIYNTRHTEGTSSVYICHLVLGGKTYKGELAGSKQMAKQVAAQSAIESLLGMYVDSLVFLYLQCLKTCFNTDGIVGSSGSGPKRKTETNNCGRNKMRRFGN